MIRLLNVSKIFNRNRPDEFAALDDVNLSIGANKMIVLRGPSGSGKTTLLSIVGCMSKPTQGRVFIDGTEVTSLPDRFLTAIRRRTFGFIFQQFYLIRGITTLENVMLPALPLGEKRGPLTERALALLEVLGIAQKARAKIESLSGGEAQRAAIARALINNPPLIIADEPTSHLDTKLSRDFLSIMERLHGEGRTVLFASHDPLVYEWNAIDDIYDIRDGKILDKGRER